MGQTIAEKILSRHSGKRLRAGDIAICKIDFCFSQDGTSALVIDAFNKLKARRIFKKNGFYMVVDHSAPSPNIGVSAIHKKMRDFAGSKHAGMYDIGEGVCHLVVPENGHITCGDLVLGADSHTCSYGAINVFATGVGSTDLAIAAASGKNWFKVPESVKILISGKPQKGVYSKDIILHIIKTLTARGCTYKSMEFSGPTISNLSIDARFTISNMAVEVGAKTGLMEADKKTLSWVKKHSQKKPVPTNPDKDAKYESVKEFNISGLTPQVAKPHTVDNVSSVTDLKDIKIQQAFIGTCTNGRLEDLEIAASILKKHKVKPGVRLIMAPASRTIFLHAIKKGLIDVFVKAGAAIVSPGCGPCVGTHNGVPADGENVISTANRNFKGRMGNPNAFIYLASPATVAASAVYGKIADPRRLTD
jgi:3-isopropylmalate/(R)-2-methylmalate dehydratase large subunit